MDDARVDEVIAAITGVARTGRLGDGKIFVLPAMAVDGSRRAARPAPPRLTDPIRRA